MDVFCSDYVDESHPVLDPLLGAWRIGIARTIIYFIFLKKERKKSKLGRNEDA